MYADLKRTKCSICRKEHDNKSYYCKPCKKKWRANYNALNREKLRAYETKRQLQRHYQMDEKSYEQLFIHQKGCCAICRRHQKELRRKLAVDHEHRSKKIRGLLCDNCNPGLGYFKDSVELLKLAADYLMKFQN